jgi:hypothetical protein
MSGGKQQVELIVKAWDYSATFVEEIGGNCRGCDVIEAAISRLYDRLEGPDGASITLCRPNGDTMLCDDDEGCEEDWLKKMVVSSRIIGWIPPTLNEVRAQNGAPPVPDGDRPWDPG